MKLYDQPIIMKLVKIIRSFVEIFIFWIVSLIEQLI